MKDKVFRRLQDRTVIDLVPYVKQKLSERDDIKIYIGTDSQNHKRKSHYALVVVLHYGNNGGHVLYHKEIVPRIRDRFSRLWKEVEMSMELAQYLEAQGLPKATYIDLDLNPDPKFRSNDVLRAALGYVTGQGYVPRIKTEGEIATRVADKLCK